MTVPTKPRKLPTDVMTATQIRRCVFTLALGMWGMFAVMAHSNGVAFPRALEIGFWSGMGGFLVWWVYHLASRRNNGAIIVMCLNPFSDHYYKDVDYRLAITFKTLIFSLIFFGVGFACRKLQRSPDSGDASAVDGTPETPERSA